MPKISIQGTVIDFPDSGTSPDWSEAVIAFAEAVTSALNLVVGNYNIQPQTQDISASNPGTSVNIGSLNFSTALIRSVSVSYAVYRTTNSTTAYEFGNLNAVYSPNNPTNSKWEMSQSRTGNGQISFYMTDTGQMQYTTTTISGTGHSGKISFSATALTQS